MGTDAFTFGGDWSGGLVAAAVHAGHDVRADVVPAMALDGAARLREEDPFTDVLAAGAPAHVLVHRSRFEVDLNRTRDAAVYLRPEDSWGLEVWRRGHPVEGLVAGSLRVYDRFYAELGERLDRVAAQRPFVVYDVHSYNHVRDGAPDPGTNPEVNLGTGTVDPRFRPVADAFLGSLGEQEVAGHRLDVRADVRFHGRALARWVHERYPGRGVCLAVDCRKDFMDGPSGRVDEAHLAQLRDALAATNELVLAALERVSRS